MTADLAPEVANFRTPRGASASMSWRPGTNDWNTLVSCITEDEYGLASVHLSAGQVAVDVGAYAGGVSIALAIDNPDSRVLAVEPLPPNVDLIAENIGRNGLGERVTLLPMAVVKPGVARTTIRWAFDDTESGRHHRYVGNSSLAPAGLAQTALVDGVTLGALVAMGNGRIDFLKVDCEGGEYDLFADADALRSVGDIRGEYHDGWDRLVRLLEATHVVTQMGACTDTFGGFRAVPR